MALLIRSDKWYLGGGDRLLWAPPFPVWLEHPGLWDEAHYFNHSIFPCFTWTLLDGRGRQYPLRRMSKPEDVAYPVVFLASDRAGFITGQTLSASGGFSMV